MLAGRPIGPFLFELRPIYPFLADALSFVISVASLACVKGRKVVGSPPGSVSAKQLQNDIIDGFRWLYRDKHARITVALMAGTTLIAQALIMIFLAEAHDRDMPTAAIGVILAASSAGGVAGSMIAGQLPDWARSYWLQIQMCAWSIALALLAVAGGQSVPLIAFAMVVFGLTGAIGNVKFGTYLFQHVADNMIAKVTSIGQILAIGACALGPMLGGATIQQFGTQYAVLVLLGIVVTLALASFCAPGLWTGFRTHLLMPTEWLNLVGAACAALGWRVQTRGHALMGLAWRWCVKRARNLLTTSAEGAAACAGAGR